MINPNSYLDNLISKNINFFTGVPDSLLKHLCACISYRQKQHSHIIAANEGAAIGLGIGSYIGSGKLPFIYLQNSGLGNVINPILSLSSPEVYGIPMLIMVGWRGEPGIKDEPQHIHQGRVMIDLIESMNMPYEILEKNEKIAIEQTNNAIQTSEDMKSPFFLIVKKNSFNNFSIDDDNTKKINLSREEAIISAASNLSNNSLIVSTTGMPSRELFEHRVSNKENHNRDFLTVGGMGHASQISLGIALQQKNRNIYCFDGDGAAIMHMGSFAVIGQSDANNLTHIIFNNGAHDSVGGQPTVGLDINFCEIAKSCGYKSSVSVDNVEELNKEIIKTKHRDGPYFIEVIVKKGNRSDLGRPTRTPSQNKLDLINYINRTNS